MYAQNRTVDQRNKLMHARQYTTEWTKAVSEPIKVGRKAFKTPTKFSTTARLQVAPKKRLDCRRATCAATAPFTQ